MDLQNKNAKRKDYNNEVTKKMQEAAIKQGNIKILKLEKQIAL